MLNHIIVFFICQHGYMFYFLGAGLGYCAINSVKNWFLWLGFHQHLFAPPMGAGFALPYRSHQPSRILTCISYTLRVRSS